MNEKNQNNISRRQFLNRLSIIPFLTVPVFATTPKVPKKLFFRNTTQQKIRNVPLAGFQFYKGEKIWGQLTPKDPLKLTHEADNKYDTNAIVVSWRDYQLGYIPRRESKSFVGLMDEGKQLNAEIITLSESDNPWKRIEIAVYLNG